MSTNQSIENPLELSTTAIGKFFSHVSDRIKLGLIDGNHPSNNDIINLFHQAAREDNIDSRILDEIQRLGSDSELTQKLDQGWHRVTKLYLTARMRAKFWEIPTSQK
ncbi:hypothetical protein AB835_06945 [Candidatus Endobugula sertula]|uniref:Uncharacterized protein n=1 Tax=Candidatus Endobugula sertula TaxID=62101 RepID=A0A1D2QQE2_9GAMM|nr:hypothetical protein AB835_06945 [Candidatus Endobugula sertula]